LSKARSVTIRGVASGARLSGGIFNGVITCYIILHCDQQLVFTDLFVFCPYRPAEKKEENTF